MVSANYQAEDCGDTKSEGDQMPSSTEYAENTMSAPEPTDQPNDSTTAKNETFANPKPVMGRKLSSKKFQIQSVAVRDDPLYNPNASSPYMPRRKLSREVNVDELPPSIEILPAGATNKRTEPEGSGGEGEFQSVEDLLSKPRSASEEQKFFSVEDLSRQNSQAKTTIEPNGLSTSQISITTDDPKRHSNGASLPSLNESSTDDGEVGFVLGGDNSGAITYRQPRGLHHLNFDDSFKKRATVETRMDKSNLDPEAAVTDIFVPVPSQPASHENTINEYMVHDTIQSTYQTNLSLNKLFAERHKPTLALFGRALGSKQRELEKQKSAASLIVSSFAAFVPPSAVMSPKKKKKRPCHCLRLIHVGLLLTAIVIIGAVIAPLTLIKSSRDNEFAIFGYHFDYINRVLDIYPWTDASHLLSHVDVIFKGHFGVNFDKTVPYNCSSVKNKTAENLDTSECFKWKNESTLRMTRSQPAQYQKALCINIEWESEVVTPILEDCIDLDPHYGSWYGGFINDSKSFPVGQQDVPYGSYLPGQSFGHLVEKFWLSTRGMAVVASDDFPLHVRVDTTDPGRLCLSSWYGHQDLYINQTRKLSYSICRTESYKDTHKLVMDKFYSSGSIQNRTIDPLLLSQPVFTTSSGDIKTFRAKLEEKGLNSSGYVLNSHDNRLVEVLSGVGTIESLREGFQISPLIPLTVALDHLSTDMWIESIDMNVPRLFKGQSSAYAMLNPGSPYTQSLIQNTVANTSNLVLINNLTIGEVSGQEFYPYQENTQTFQPYVRNFVDSVIAASTGSVMTSEASGMQSSSVIYQLPASDNIADIVLKILHSSMMGYNVISTSAISAETFSKDEVIRLMQLSIFLPITQFSESVLDYFDDPVVKQMWEGCLETREFLNIETMINKHLLSSPTAPLYTPIWWENSITNDANLRRHTEFMFADYFLVVPIVDVNRTSRIVYFPDKNTSWYWTDHKLSNSPSPYAKKAYKGGDTEEFTDLQPHDLLVFERI